MFYVYCFTNKINAKKYIGVTNNIKRRFAQHRRAKNRNSYFHRSIRKYGIKAFLSEILYQTPNKKEVLMKERFFIAQHQTLNSNKGYNLTSGGEKIAGWYYSKEMKEKMRKNNWAKNPKNRRILKNATKRIVEYAKKYHIGNKYRLGTTHTKEAKAIISEKASKNYRIISPDGTEYYCKNLREFCKTNNIPFNAHLYQVALGKKDTYLGYKVYKT